MLDRVLERGHCYAVCTAARAMLVLAAGCGQVPSGEELRVGRAEAALTTCPPGDTLGSAVLNVGPTRSELSTLESALTCLASKRLVGPVEIVLEPGVYRPFEQAGRTRAVAISHPEAHFLTIRGTPPLDIGLEAFNSVEAVDDASDGAVDYYRFKYNIAPGDWNAIVQQLDALPTGAYAYALIRRTREATTLVGGEVQPDGRKHAIHRGVWQVDPSHSSDRQPARRTFALPAREGRSLWNGTAALLARR